MDPFEKELKDGFLEEAEQAILEAEGCFLSLETDPGNPEILNKIFRLAHNLKGSSKAVGFEQMAVFTHQFENLILKVKEKQIEVSPVVINLLLKCNDFTREMVLGLKKSLDAVFEINPIVAEIEGVLNGQVGTPCAEAPAPGFTPVFNETKNENKQPAAPQSEESVIRVSVSKVEKLLNSVGELAILQSVLLEQIAAAGSLAMKKNVQQLSKISKEIQDISMGLRMVPVKPTFLKMQRVIRDTSQLLAKDVNVVLEGEETELDKSILERMHDPMVHLVRNSVDHGIEDRETRKRNGKPENGTVTLRAYHKSGKIVIEVQEDGGGIDPSYIRRKAVEKNLLNESDVLSEPELLKLIFLPGFSTKESVTEVSGRGVGMDVVRTNIRELGGDVLIDSVVGKGTTFRVILPLTLAIIDGMILQCGEHKFVLPMAHIHEALRPTKDQLQWRTHLGNSLLLRGKNIPAFRLGDMFGLKDDGDDLVALVVQAGDLTIALLVGAIVGQTQVVIKSLGDELRSCIGISGTTILGDGKPALILEPQDLVKRRIDPKIFLSQNGVAKEKVV